MTPDQFQGMTLNLVTLSHVDLSDADEEQLVTLLYMLERASANVARAIADKAGGAEAARKYEKEHGEPPF
jgi:hypothetical protein